LWQKEDIPIRGAYHPIIFTLLRHELDSSGERRAREREEDQRRLRLGGQRSKRIYNYIMGVNRCEALQQQQNVQDGDILLPCIVLQRIGGNQC